MAMRWAVERHFALTATIAVPVPLSAQTTYRLKGTTRTHRTPNVAMRTRMLTPCRCRRTHQPLSEAPDCISLPATRVSLDGAPAGRAVACRPGRRASRPGCETPPG